MFPTAQEFYDAVVRLYIKKLNIHVKKWYRSLNAASYIAFQESGTVMLPIPRNRQAFLVCLHEIGHIAEGYHELSHVNEYNAEMFVIREAKKWEVDTDMYEFKAKKYVLAHLINDWNEGNAKRIKPEIKRWLNISPAKWRGYKLKLNEDYSVSKLKDVKRVKDALK
jgi:hypothetical protein